MPASRGKSLPLLRPEGNQLSFAISVAPDQRKVCVIEISTHCCYLTTAFLQLSEK